MALSEAKILTNFNRESSLSYSNPFPHSFCRWISVCSKFVAYLRLRVDFRRVWHIRSTLVYGLVLDDPDVTVSIVVVPLWLLRELRGLLIVKWRQGH